MKNMIGRAVLIAGLGIMSSAYAASSDDWMHPKGEAISSSQDTEVITIYPDTRWVNLSPDDQVKFVDAKTGASFAWEFDTPDSATIALSSIAPSGFESGKNARIYVAPRFHDDD